MSSCSANPSPSRPGTTTVVARSCFRSGRSLEEERRSLWHELVHAERGDTECAGWAGSAVERRVEREAARRAMPVVVMERRLAVATDWDDFVWHMKVPEGWVRFRLAHALPAERARLERACWWSDWTATA